MARSSRASASVMTLLKIAAGLLSGSLGVLSDAARFGTGSGGRGADVLLGSCDATSQPTKTIPMATGKIENLSAFSEAGADGAPPAHGLSGGGCRTKIFYHPVEVHHSLWPVLVLVTSIAVDIWRSRQLRAVAVRTRFAGVGDPDAFHFASGHLGNIGSAGCSGWARRGQASDSKLAHCTMPIRWRAVAVSLLILHMTVRVGHEAVAALVDEIPAETRRRLVREVERVDGVLAVERARVRRAGAGYFADVTLALPRRFTFEHTGELVRAATAAVQRALPTADVVIHTVPREIQGGEHLRSRARSGGAKQCVSARAEHPNASWGAAG